MLAADDFETLSPNSKWIVSYDTDGCRLVRYFGEGDDNVLLIFNRYGPSEAFSLTLAGERFKLRRDNKPLTIRFGTEGEQEENFYPGSLGEKPALIQGGSMRLAPLTEAQKNAVEDSKPQYYYDPPPIGSAREAAITAVSIGGNLRKPVLLQTGPMDKPMAAFSTCTDNLVTSWGLDPEKQKKLSREAAPAENYGRWITTNDYPMDMVRAGQPAIVQFRLNVDASGRATDCHIQSTTRPKEFDAAVCRSLMKRASFIPALDSDGKPVPSFWRNTVRFEP